MMTATNAQIKRVFQQMDAALRRVANLPDRKSYAFGMAISFVTTIFVLSKQLSDEARLTADDAQRKVVEECINRGWLTVTQSFIDQSKDGGNQINAHLRHLRNCFGHGNWSYDEQAVETTGSAMMELFDYNTAEPPQRRFEATIQAHDLIDFALMLLVETFNSL